MIDDVKGSGDSESFAIIGAAMEVHRLLGQGFLEAVYQEALALEFTEKKVVFRREVSLPVFYKGQPLTVFYRADFLCYETYLVELKALGSLGGKEYSQVMNYMKATGIARALLFNFGTGRLEYKRLILTASP